jgi:hypothetical protein
MIAFAYPYNSHPPRLDIIHKSQNHELYLYRYEVYRRLGIGVRGPIEHT